MSREPSRSCDVAVVSTPRRPNEVVAPVQGILRRDGRAIRVDDPAVREMEPRRQYPGVGDVAEFLQHIANDGQWLVHSVPLLPRPKLPPPPRAPDKTRAPAASNRSPAATCSWGDQPAARAADRRSASRLWRTPGAGFASGEPGPPAAPGSAQAARRRVRRCGPLGS